MPRQIKQGRTNDGYPLKIFGGGFNRYVCHYCGLPAETLDHIPPVSFSCSNQERYRVPCCNECNSLLGNRHGATFGDRQDAVKQLLMKRYRSALRCPDWKTCDLEALGDELRRSVESALELKRALLKRLAFSIKR